MKTPIQEFYEWMEQNQYFVGNDLYGKYHELLEKEKEVIEKAWWAGCDEGASDHMIYPSEDCNGYYNETFNTKER